jgi:hypothetical protein
MADGVTLYGLAHLALDAFDELTAAEAHFVISEDNEDAVDDDKLQPEQLTLERVRNVLGELVHDGAACAERDSKRGIVYWLARTPSESETTL